MPRGKKLTEEEIGRLASAEIQAATAYDGTDFQKDRVRALEYYRGEMNDVENEEGGAQILSEPEDQDRRSHCFEQPNPRNYSLSLGVRRLGIDDVAFARKFLAGNALSPRQRRFPNLIAGGAAGVIRVDRRVRMHWRRSSNGCGRS